METTYLYVVHSDTDEQNLYAEFFDKDKAIAYAKANESDLTWVEELEVSLDEDQEVIDVFNAETIWVAGMGMEDTPTKEVDYDMPTREDDDRRDSFEDLVEKLEENENMVECKECFDLFPKADCIKLDIGYICPTCSEAGKVFTVSDENTFKLDFPEYEKFDNRNEMIPEEDDSNISVIENEPISTPEEAIDFLVKDEKEAIAGYEQAAEVVEASDVENKEEILDTLDHIKEEEEEHIEELAELVEIDEPEVPEDETDSISDKEVEDIVQKAEETIESDEELVEHVNEEHPAIESDQKLVGTDNAVVDCETVKVITHSEDEKPLDCKMEKDPLTTPLTESSVIQGSYEISEVSSLS